MIARRVSTMALLALTFGAAGCGSDGPDGPQAPCVTGELSLLGELDGQHVDGSTAFADWSFQQLTPPHSLDLPAAGGVLHLEWSPLIQVGGSGAASGWVVMPAAAPHAGETICGAGTVGYRDLGSNGTGGSDYFFTLANLSMGPTCPGTSLAGSLAGCAQTPGF